ncbi:hypothetical protein [Ornithinimicrobium panacihumi]|uniref:hypothetical protein n=1 Tax=Ornithinimicrobium panacihumi TaxID=2008449 RepID=UPI003F89884F
MAVGTPVDELTSRSFDSVDELRTALVDAGVPCENPTTFSGPEFAEGLRCDGGVWLTTYEDDDSQAAKVEEYTAQGTNFVEGVRWLLVAPKAHLGQGR